MYAQSVAVALYMDSQVLTGFLSVPSGKRLSDFLNYDLVGQSETIGTYLKLTDSTVSNTDGTREKTETIYINREAIQMLRTIENDSARGIGAKDGPKQYPFVHKSPVRAKMCMRRYELDGYVHCASGQKVSQLLAQGLTFLPCTDARIREARGGDWWQAGFVAINKRQVCSLHQEE